MAITSGFYNAVLQGGEWDRVYTAEQFSQIFDGIINDGVYEAVGNKFMVSPDSATNMGIIIGSGRAWFQHSWTLNDSGLTITLSNPDTSRPRIDAVVLEIDAAGRENRISVINGTPKASNPDKPTLSSNQYPLAYIRVKAGSPYRINASEIENAVGTSACPYVTGIIQVTSIDQLVAQWQALWDAWLTNTQSQADVMLDYLETEIVEIEADTGVELKPCAAYDISISQSSWVTFTPSANTEEYKIKSQGYNYRAKIPVNNVLSSMRPYVTWSLPSLEDAQADILNQYQCTSGGVYAYATERPTGAVTVLTVECRKTALPE